MKNNLNLNSINENNNITDKNKNILMNNINIFKMAHKDRNNTKLYNQLLFKDNNNKEKNIIELKNKNKYIISNKFSKKYRG